MILILIIITIIKTIIIIIIINNFLNKFSGGMSGRVVNTSNSGSEDLGFKPRPLRCFFSSPRCINGYRRHTAGG